MFKYDPNIVSARIRALRLEHDISQKKISQDFGLYQSAISKSESGDSLTFDLILKYAAYYRVSTDYLLGLTDDRTPHYSIPDSFPRAAEPKIKHAVHPSDESSMLNSPEFQSILNDAINRILDERGILQKKEAQNQDNAATA